MLLYLLRDWRDPAMLPNEALFKDVAHLFGLMKKRFHQATATIGFPPTYLERVDRL